MLETMRDALLALRSVVAWLPSGVMALIILAVACLAALSIPRMTLLILDRHLPGQHPFLRSFLARTENLMRFAILLVALFISLPTVPFNPAIITVLTKVLALATIVLLGWTVIAAANMAAELYLLRLRLDVDDNLLARKHVTQVRILLRTAE